MEVEANDDYDFIPGTPPHKKVILVYMLFLDTMISPYYKLPKSLGLR